MSDVRVMTEEEIPLWAAMRSKLWPDCGPGDNATDIAACKSGGPVKIVFLAFDGNEVLGFAEISERSIADGCGNDPVAYVEGWYVEPERRGEGIGSALIAAAADWARKKSYDYLASDAELDNKVSQGVHEALGFEETGRVINYRMRLQS